MSYRCCGEAVSNCLSLYFLYFLCYDTTIEALVDYRQLVIIAVFRILILRLRSRKLKTIDIAKDYCLM